jgi:hypothetical protein
LLIYFDALMAMTAVDLLTDELLKRDSISDEVLIDN